MRRAFHSCGSRERTLVGAGVVLAMLGVFGGMAVVRYVDVDEGTYVIASDLVRQGLTPYIDFLYVQMPLLPYVYGGWLDVAGESWYAARILSVVFATVLGALLYWDVSGRVGARAGLLAAVLYGGSALVVVWYPTVKTYALSTLLLFVAYILVRRARTRVDWIAAGLLAGLAVDTRLMLAAPLIVFVWLALRSRTVPPSWAAASFVAGLAAGLLPSLVLLASDPERFVFANLRYHALKCEGGLFGDLEEKLRAAANLIGIPDATPATFQFALLVLGAVAAVVVSRATARSTPFGSAFTIAMLLVVASLAATPTYSQYVATAVPFLAAGIAESVGNAAGGFDDRAARIRIVTAMVALGVCGYVVAGAVDVRRTALAYPDQRIGAVEAVAREVDRRSSPGDHVAASWPGYLFGTGLLPVEGLETDFAPPAAAQVSVDDAKRFRMARAEDVERVLRTRGVRLAVVKRWHTGEPQPNWEEALEGGGFRLVAELAIRGSAEVGGAVRIYEAGRR